MLSRHYRGRQIAFHFPAQRSGGGEGDRGGEKGKNGRPTTEEKLAHIPTSLSLAGMSPLMTMMPHLVCPPIDVRRRQH